MSSRRPLKLLHTSDLHLGDGGPSAQPALNAVFDLGLRLAADALLIAGDLFDHNRVSAEEAAPFLERVRRFERPVIILPGNHDCFDDSSVYRSARFGPVPANLHLIADGNGTPLHLSEIDLAVWGRPTVVHEPAFHPLIDVPERPPDSWYIVLGHGHLVERPGDLLRSSPILPEEIASAPCDYVALGHWEVFKDVSQGSVPAFYSGSPRVRSSYDAATAVLVELNGAGIVINRHALE